MITRITSAIVGVTAFVLLALGIPLAIAVEHSVTNAEIVKLQATSAATLGQIAVPLDVEQLDSLAHESDAPPPFSVYDADGSLMFGSGPDPGDLPTQRARVRQEVVTDSGGELIVATPITDGTKEIEGVLRLAVSREEADERTRSIWAVMAAAAAAALGGAWVLARRLARQLAAPIEELAARAEDLIDGVDRSDLPHTGFAEIDKLADALHESSTRTTNALARERQFSADVSHQLRTPLAGLRLKLETVNADASASELAAAVLGDLDRVEATVTQLLALARDATPSATPAPIDRMVDEAVERWRNRVEALDRSIRGTARTQRSVLASANGIGQVLDVLVDNALRHGRGDVVLTARTLPRGVAVDVSDEGTLAADVTERSLFQRRDGDGHGIGLSLARALAEADNARLLLTARTPTTLTLFLVSPEG